MGDITEFLVASVNSCCLACWQASQGDLKVVDIRKLCKAGSNDKAEGTEATVEVL